MKEEKIKKLIDGHACAFLIKKPSLNVNALKPV